MKNIYDNGEAIIGKVENIVNSLIKELNKDENESYSIMLGEIRQLKLKKDDILCIYYDMPFGYSYQFWNKSDIIKK